jgi:hypothetical protein
MSSPSIARQAGLLSIVAAVLILVSQVSQLIIPMAMPESFWIATHTLRMGFALVAMFALLLALIGLYSRQESVVGRIGLVGYLVALLGTTLVAGDWWYEAFIVPVLRDQAPALLATAPSGSIVVGAAVTVGTFAVGWLIFGLASARAQILPRSAAILMIVASIPAILALVAPFQVPLAVAVGWIGVSLVRSDARETLAARSAAAAAA